MRVIHNIAEGDLLSGGRLKFFEATGRATFSYATNVR
jgi:hypothetical protein